MYALSLLIGVGAGLGLAWVGWKMAIESVYLHLDAGLWVLAGSLVGARAGYVALNWGYFRQHLHEIWQVYLGGLAWPGAFAGGLLGVALFARVAHQPPGALADAILPLATSVTLFAWLGCWLDGCAYGQASQAWWALPGRDEWGTMAPRLPLQLVLALLSLASLWFVEQNRAHFAKAGQAAAVWLGAIAAQLLLAAFLRADPAPAWQGIRLDAWGASVFILLAFIYFAFTLVRRPAATEEGSGSTP